METSPAAHVHHRRPRRRTALHQSKQTAVAVAAALACAVATQTAEVSIAAPASAATDDFYRPPSHIATRPGTLVKTRPATMLLQIPGKPGHFPAEQRP